MLILYIREVGFRPNYLMVGDPATGIRGAAVSTLYCYALIAVINLAAIARLVPPES